MDYQLLTNCKSELTVRQGPGPMKSNPGIKPGVKTSFGSFQSRFSVSKTTANS